MSKHRRTAHHLTMHRVVLTTISYLTGAIAALAAEPPEDDADGMAWNTRAGAAHQRRRAPRAGCCRPGRGRGLEPRLCASAPCGPRWTPMPRWRSCRSSGFHRFLLG